jgi:hypothetical protein
LKESPRKRKLERFMPIIHEILQQDQQAPKKQQHTAQRILHRLRNDFQYDGGLTIVKDVVRARKQRQARFLCRWRIGQARVDFGEASWPTVQDSAVRDDVALVDAIFCQLFPRGPI